MGGINTDLTMSSTDTRTRSLAKAFSWRFVALGVTAVVSYVATGSFALAASIGLADSAIKIFAYYGHERTWENVDFGRSPASRETLAEGPGVALGADDPLCDELRRAA